MVGSDRRRGPGAWNNSVRSRWYLHGRAQSPGKIDETPNDRVRILTKKKANYSSTGDAVELEWRAGFLHRASGLARVLYSNLLSAMRRSDSKLPDGGFDGEIG